MSRALRRSAVVLIAWGLWLGALTAIQAAFVVQPFVKWFLVGLLGGASFAVLTCGVAVLVRDLLRRRATLPVSTIVESSAATVTIVAGVALAILGANFGLWAAAIGGGLALLGVGGIVREERARRRALLRSRALRARERIAEQERGSARLAGEAKGSA